MHVPDLNLVATQAFGHDLGIFEMILTFGFLRYIVSEEHFLCLVKYRYHIIVIMVFLIVVRLKFQMDRLTTLLASQTLWHTFVPKP